MLISRASERARIDGLLDGAQAGRSGALVLRGEAGIGKTALLDYAVAQAEGARVLRVTGVETESEFAYAGLHELVRPLLDRLPDVTPVQADALRGALGLGPSRGAGRLYIGAATLSLLAGATDGPLLCVIDDAHWLDEASAAALTFATRRLEAESVVMLFAARDDGFAAPGLPEVRLEGIDAEAALVLLSQASDVRVPRQVADELVVATAGNPLALLELPSRLSSEQLRGIRPLPHPLPVGENLKVVFATRASMLSEEARRALVLAAAADTRALRVLTRVAEVTPSALEECEEAGLVALESGQITFRHPLVRAAVYHSAAPAERRAAHAALAAGFAGEGAYADRRAWHLAAASVEPNEEVAAQLELSALSARTRRGHVAAAAMLERAAHLSPSAARRARRLHLAAHSAWLAGQAGRAVEMLNAAAVDADDAVQTDICHLRARIDLQTDARANVVDRLVAEAERVESFDPQRASALLTTAAAAAPAARRLDLARRAVWGAGGEDATGFLARLVLARALLDAGEDAEAHERLAEAHAAATALEELRHDPEVILAALEALAGAAPVGGRLLRELLTEVTAASRAHAVVALPRALLQTAWLDVEDGRWTDASLAFHEAAQLAAEIDQRRERAAAVGGAMLLDALRGRPLEPAALRELGLAAARIRASHALAAGEAETAITELRTAAAADAPPVRGLPPVEVDLVEAYVRAGRHDDAKVLAAGLEGGWGAWARALVDGSAATYDAAAAIVSSRPFLRARVELARGEQLRREGARRAARESLRAALATFEQLDAEPWAERARRELRASGETARRREPSTVDELTPQELQIARMIAAGATQKEAAARLYLSPKTIEYHLGKVYRKLDIASGRQLQHRLAEHELLQTS